MSSALYVKLDRVSRLIDDVLDSEGPLPREIETPLCRARNDVLRSRGKPIVQRELFKPGDRVCFIIQSYTGTQRELVPGAIGAISSYQLNVMKGVLIPNPVRRSPNAIETLEKKPWLFTGDLPASTSSAIARFVQVDLSTEIRELFQYKTDHWSTWRSYWAGQGGMHTWGTATMFPDEEEV